MSSICVEGGADGERGAENTQEETLAAEDAGDAWICVEKEAALVKSKSYRGTVCVGGMRE